VSAATNVLQLVRAHYQKNEPAFAGAAAALARCAKTPLIQREIADLIRRGYQERTPGRAEEVMRPLKAAPIGAMNPLPQVGFDDLQLDASLQLALDEFVQELEYRDELAARKLRARNRFLFHGPPGNGKTSSAAALANALGVQAYCVSIPRISSEYMGGTGKALDTLFSSIRDGMVVVFDELDAIGTRRGSGSSAAGKEQNQILNVMLTAFDAHRSGVIVATTNRQEIIDEALLRRFDEQVLFPAPSLEQMQSLAWKLCQKFGVPPVNVNDCQNLDEVTKRVEATARRLVMKELIAADSDDESDNQDTSMN
jgi:SpoVK/Ycf46/Vps4 family AAA+-type ATPase